MKQPQYGGQKSWSLNNCEIALFQQTGDTTSTIRKMNPDYDIVIKRLHPYYDIKLLTFGIDRDKNLIVQFQVFKQPYTQHPPVLYQIETVMDPIIDKNKQADSYTHLQIGRSYIALNT